MSQEIHYTSVPRGLKPGSRGFCTVAATAQMSATLIERLEAISGYQPVFSPNDPSATLNPIAYSHLRVRVGGKVLSVVSRIGPAGLDYSGRPNKYAHHIVLEGNERPEGGPAWLLSQPGFVQTAWDGEPRDIPLGRIPPQGGRQPGVARAWQVLTDDAGWAGTLAEMFLTDPRRPVFLVFRPGMDLLPLIEEALALLPPSRRWEVDFSTYFSQLPQGVTCAWRGVLEGSEEVSNARRLPNALVLDLCSPLGRAEGGALVHLARTGERREPPDSGSIASSATDPNSQPTRTGRDPNIFVSPSRSQITAPQPRFSDGGYQLLPDLARLAGELADDHHRNAGLVRRRRKSSWALIAVIAAACVIPLVAAGFFLQSAGLMELPGSNPELNRKIAATREKASEERKRPQTETAKKEPGPAAHPPKPEEGRTANDGSNKEPAAERPRVDKKEDVRVVATPAPPNLDPGKGKPKESQIDFFALPRNEPSMAGAAGKMPETKMIKDIATISDIKIVNLSNLTSEGNRNEGWRVKPKSISGLGGDPIAEFLAEKNVVHFKWLKAGKQASPTTEALRDGVLKVTGIDGKEFSILLRDPGIIGHEAFDLTRPPENSAERPLNDYKTRESVLPWATPNAIVDTKWKLGIRKWKILSSLDDKVAETVMAEGNPSEASATVKWDIILDEVKLTIDIEPDKPHLVRLRMKFVKDTILRKSKNRVEILKQDQIDKNKLGELKKNAELNKNDIHDLETKINSNKTLAEESLRKQDLIRHLGQSKRVKLSLVISIKLDDSTKIIDVAKFGEFAVTKH